MAVTRDPAALALVFVGGVVGTVMRASLVLLNAGAWPWGTLAVNLTGALLLGALLEVVARAAWDDAWRRRVRFGLGAGLLGSYTTYSAFALEAVTRDPWWLGGAYALVSVVAGVAAAWLGVRLGRLVRS